MICNCTLAGTRACLQCSQYKKYFGEDLQWNYPKEIILPKKEIIEKFDENGNLIERITKEV